MIKNNHFCFFNYIFLQIFLKEIKLFFSFFRSYLLYIFFSAISILIFFWQDVFFIRNTADIKIFFNAIPALFFFLCPILVYLCTRKESAVSRDYLIAHGAPLWNLVLGKILSCLFLLFLFLVSTFAFPIVVSFFGALDIGVVCLGYLFSLLLGLFCFSVLIFAFYLFNCNAFGLVFGCAILLFLYFLDSGFLLLSPNVLLEQCLKFLGFSLKTNDAFNGILNLYDVFYFISFSIAFIVVTMFLLEKYQLSKLFDISNVRASMFTYLLILNLFFLNCTFNFFDKKLRFDITQDRIFSFSPLTAKYLHEISEPMNIKFFFNKDVPELLPLVDKLKSTLHEYGVRSKGKVIFSIHDLSSDVQQRERIQNLYNLDPKKIAINLDNKNILQKIYFDVLLEYKDSYVIVSLHDLVLSLSNNRLELRDFESEITGAIKNLIKSNHFEGGIFNLIMNDLEFSIYSSEDAALPDDIAKFKHKALSFVDSLAKDSNGRLSIVNNIINKDNIDHYQSRLSSLGVSPVTVNPLEEDHYYFYMILKDKNKFFKIPFSELSLPIFKNNFIKYLLKFNGKNDKNIGFYGADSDEVNSSSLHSFSFIKDYLANYNNIYDLDLSSGAVDGDIDLLVVTSYASFGEKEKFAVDQFLMKGGTLFVLASPYSSMFNDSGTVSFKEQKSGLLDLLEFYGITLNRKLVADSHNKKYLSSSGSNLFSSPSSINIFNYPLFLNISINDYIDDDIGFFGSAVNQAFVAWASPISFNQVSDNSLVKKTILNSSSDSWLVDYSFSFDDVDSKKYASNTEFKSTYDLGVVFEGLMKSYFHNKKLDFIESDTESNNKLINRSLINSRVVLFSSVLSFSDYIFSISSSLHDDYNHGLMRLFENTIDYSLLNSDALQIKSSKFISNPLVASIENYKITLEFYAFLISLLIVVIYFTANLFFKKKSYNFYAKLFSAERRGC